MTEFTEAKNIQDKEFKKFVDAGDGKVSIRNLNNNPSSNPSRSLIVGLRLTPVTGFISVESGSPIEAKVDATAVVGRRTLVIHNNGSKVVVWGPSDVTFETGIPLASNEKASFDLDEDSVVGIFLISDAAQPVNVRIAELV